MKKSRRILSLVLAFAMFCSVIQGQASAFANGDEGAFTIKNATAVVDGTSDVEVTIDFTSTESDTYVMFEGFFAKTDNSGKIALSSMKAGYPDGTNDNYVNANDGKFAYFDGGLNGIEFEQGASIVTATYIVPANTEPGVYTVKITDVLAMDVDGHELEASYTATITVEEPAAQAAPYEIYYELTDGKLDGDNDKYAEYDAATVTAAVYMKNNTGSDITMQAYDIFLSYDSDYLKYSSETLDGVAYAANSETEAAVGAVVEHIQLVKGTKTITLTNGQAVLLGNIVFDIDTANVPDAEALDLKILVAADTTNTAKAEKVTNFAVEKNQTSYYPADKSAMKGVEMASYTVTYNANGGTGAPDEQTKYYGKDLPLSTTEPTRDNYKFNGWLGSDNKTYAAGDPYSGNADLELTAQWKVNAFTVTWYDANGVEIYHVTVNYESTVSFDESYTEPSKAPDAQYTYTLKGWTTDSNPELNADVLDLTTYKIKETTKLYPVFSTTTNTYTVIWNNYDNTELEKDEKVPYGMTPTYNGDTPKRESTAQYEYSWTGWNPAVDVVTGNATYTATFVETLRSYTVTFNMNGHGTAIGGKTVSYGQTVEEPADPSEAHYTFGGWYTDSACSTGKEYDFSTLVTGDVTLYAKWTPNTYTVTFNANGGDGSMASQEFTYAVTQALNANSFTAPTGKSFVGWNTAADGTGTSYGNGESISLSSNITLYAQWDSVAYTVTVMPSEHGTVSANPEGGNYQAEITLTITPEAGYELDTLTVKDASQNTITVTDNKFKMPASNVTVSATFKAIDYTVTIGTIANGSVTASKTAQVHVGDEITLTSTANGGYKFVSYNVVETGSGNNITVTDGKFTMPAASVTVTATFVGIGYTVTFDKNANDATGTVNNIEATFGASITLSTAEYSRTGYTFLGWSADNNAAAATYKAGATINDVIYTPTAEGESVTLYAVWQVNTYNINVQETQNGSVSTDADANKADYGKTVTLSNTPAAGYELDGYTVQDANNAAVTVTEENGTYTFVMPASDVTVTATFKLADLAVVVDENITKGSVTATDANGDEITTAKLGDTVKLTNTPENGYELNEYIVTYKDADGVEQSVTVTEGSFTMPEHPVNVTATFNLVQYTITFKPAYGDLPDGVEATWYYTIEQNIVLPTPIRSGYSFENWKVETTAGNWQAGAECEAGDANAKTGMYGNVTLEAQWKRAVTVVVEDYKYAAIGYRLLLVDATDLDETKAYKFNGQDMYYTNDKNYLIDKTKDTGVFYLLIEETNLVQDGNTYTNELTETAYGQLTEETTKRKTLTYNGDINGDGVVNIADANAVYQMTVFGGSYYSLQQLGLENRLMADMNTDTSDANNIHRASIMDVDAILSVINS